MAAAELLVVRGEEVLIDGCTPRDCGGKLEVRPAGEIKIGIVTAQFVAMFVHGCAIGIWSDWEGIGAFGSVAR